jgi:hypothetical protein
MQGCSPRLPFSNEFPARHPQGRPGAFEAVDVADARSNEPWLRRGSVTNSKLEGCGIGIQMDLAPHSIFGCPCRLI